MTTPTDGGFEHINRIEAMRNRLAAGETTFTLDELKLTLAWADHLNYFRSLDSARLAPIPDGEVDEIRKRCDAATPGPWHVDKHDCYIWGPQGEMVADQDIAHPDVKAVVRIRGAGASLPMSENMAFIANARTDIPFLLARLAALEAENAALKAEVAGLRERHEGVVELATEDAKQYLVELAEARAKAIEECAKAVDPYKLTASLTQEREWATRLFPRVIEAIRSLSTSQGTINGQ